MRSFSCPVCGHLVVFENSTCLHCGAELGYCRSKRGLVALEGHARCANAQLARCKLAGRRARAALRLVRAHPHPAR